VSDMRFRWDGMDELRWHLQHLPEELTGQAQSIARAAANRASTRIVAAYPVSGAKKKRGGKRLRAGVTVKEEMSHYGARVVVRSGAPHAHLWEWGTGPRQNAKGANRGAMIPEEYGAEVFVPVVKEERERMNGDFVEMLKHAGIQLEVVIT
jgi:putative aminopeptidase FrvX